MGIKNPSAALAAVALVAVTGCSATLKESAQSIRIASHFDSATPFNECGLAQLPDAVSDAGSDLNIEVFTDGTLGSESEAIEQVATGELDGTVAGPSALGKWHEPVSVLESAYVFDSLDEMNQAASEPQVEQLWDGFRDETGIRVVDAWWLGARHIMTKSPVRSPEDLAGTRMRSTDNNVHMANVRGLGADPLPVPLGETYIALQQGLVQSVEGPLNIADSNGFQEVADYITLTGHVYSPIPVTISESTWQELSESDREIVTEELHRLGGKVQQCVEEQDAEVLDKWVESGEMTVVEDADLEAFRDLAHSTIPEQFSWADVYNNLAEQ